MRPGKTISANATTLKLERIALEALTLDPNNTNRHDQRGIDAIKASLNSFGLQKPIVIDKDNVVIAGNGTYQAARALGWTYIDAVRSSLTKGRRKAYAHGDNRSARFAKEDDQAVALLLAELHAEEESLVYAAGYTGDEEAALLKDHGVQAPPDQDEVPTAPNRPIPRRGDVWEMGPHRIVCGDSTQAETYQSLMPKGERAACVFTDPPYGVSYQSQSGKHAKIAGDAETGNALVELVAAVLARCNEAAKETAAFYIWHASSTRADFERAISMAGLQEVQYLFWAKPSPVLGHADYQWAHEPCFYAAKAGQKPAWYGGRAQSTVWRVGVQGRGAGWYAVAGGIVLMARNGELYLTDRRPKGKKGLRVVRVEDGQKIHLDTNLAAGTVWEVGREHAPEHPTAKPVELARRAIGNSTKREDLVLDPFLGGGCTLVAAEATGRVCRGVELEPAYVHVTIDRWQQMTGQRAQCVNRPEARI